MKSGILFLLKYSWKKEKKYIIFQFLLQILMTAVPLADTIIPKFIIDELIGAKRIEVILFWIAILLAINLIGTLAIKFLSGMSLVLKGKIFAQFQADLSDKLSQCDFERLEDPNFLDTKAKAEKFLYANGQGFGAVMDSAFNILGKVMTFAGIVAIISTLNIFIVLLFIALILLNSIYESKVREKFVKLDMEKAPVERKTGYFVNLVNNFTFGKDIRIFGIRKWISDKVRYHLIESYEFYKKQMKILYKSEYASSFINFILKGVTYIYLSIQVIGKAIGIGDFTMYITALMNFSNAMNEMMKSILDIRQFSGYYDALQNYMSIPQKMQEGKRLDIPKAPYEIKFENVSFKYAGQAAYALKNINITLKHGEKLSIVGENGAGKTTFVKLLCRLYDPTEGKITINNIDIRDIEYDKYMAILGAVFQDYKLFSFTLKENVTFMNSTKEDDKKILSMLCECGLSSKMKKLPDGVQTYVYKDFNENGFEPSGGEGQKIALARALYKNAPVIILDEPTSALDSRAEYEIYKNFSKMVENKTAVFISHRMSSSKFCDHIAVFKDGMITEYGTHDELMQMNGIYNELFSMQSEFYV